MPLLGADFRLRARPELTVSEPATDTSHQGSDTAGLVAAVLEEEARRAELGAGDGTETVLPDDLLPGVGDESLSLREVVRRGGTRTLLVLTLLNLVDEFDRVALNVLAPDIQRSLGLSDTALGVVAGASGLLLVTGAIPLGYLADRMRRTWLVAAATGVWSVAVATVGVVQNLGQLVVARLATGLGKANVLPVHNSLLADTYPIAGRSRVFGIHNLANPVGVALGPFLAGTAAAVAGGAEGWRLAFVVLAVPAIILVFATLTVREPARGRNEQLAVLGEELAADDELPISLGAGFGRLKKIRTFFFLLIGIGVLGFALFSVPLFFNLMLENRFGLDAFDRGVAESVRSIGGLIGVTVGGLYGDRLFRRNPASMVRLIAGAVVAWGALFVGALHLPTLPLVIGGGLVAQVFLTMAFVPIHSLVAAVSPYRLRALSFAMIGIYIFLIGSFFGGIITGALSDSFGEVVALTIVVPPSAVLGGALIAVGARHVKRDISLVVEELTEERDERQRISASGGDFPVLQVRNLDFSYGQVQTLFDVSFDVHQGEVLALLGTNGAGKSTLLKVVNGLLMPDRGAIRLKGRTITYAEAETRVRHGIVQVPGGKAVFPSLSVEENLLAGAHQYGWDRATVAERSERVLDRFPVLGRRLEQPAGSLSGGEQQMLALGKALLLDPEILLIDELSLGLAPVVVEQLLGVVDELRQQGITMIIVEQSLNVALALADRALFMEKGRIRFSGSAAELRERDDLARAVFLGGDIG